MADDFSEIDKMAGGYNPTTGQLPGAEVLPEGSYEAEIIRSELVKTPNTQEPIYKMVLRILSGPKAGVVFERPTFFRNDRSLDFLGGDFITLGIDASQWGKRGKSWSQELLAAAPQLKGLKVIGKRQDGKVQADGSPGFPNFYLVSKLATSSTKAPAPAGLPLTGNEKLPF